MKKSRRLMPPVWRFILFTSLIMSAMTLGITGCGDDDDGGTNNGSGSINLCDPGESKYYCLETTVTYLAGFAGRTSADSESFVDNTVTFYGVEDICADDGDGIIDKGCDVKQSGSNLTVTCSFTEEISATCTVKYDYTMSGTVTDQVIDLSGTANVTQQGTCDADAPTGTIEVAIHGDRVEGPSAPCGEGSGSDDFDLTVTKPGLVVTPNLLTAQAFGDPTNGFTLFGTFTDSDVTYTTSVFIPPVSGVPVDFPIVDPDESMAGEAEVVHIEAKYTLPIYAFSLTTVSGTLTVTKATESEIVGSFNAAGSGEATNGAQQSMEDRTLAGTFSTSVSAGPDLAGESTLENRVNKHHRKMVRTILSRIAASVEKDARGVVSP